MSRIRLLTALLFFSGVPMASAHFLWLVTERQGDGTHVKMYFGESAAPDDPELLKPLGPLEAWAIFGMRAEPRLLPLRQDQAALTAALPTDSPPQSLVLRHTYGVVTRGNESFLLHYYAKTYPSVLPGTWRPVQDPERLPLEIIPTLQADQVTFRVTWLGEAAAGVELTLHGPAIEAATATTADDGFAPLTVRQPGRYSVRARRIDATAGDHDGKKYDSQRHYSTLTFEFVPASLVPQTDRLPVLTRATTSFGGAVLANELYVYGGNYGDAHEFSNEGQSGDLWKLRLDQPQAWERVLTGPKLQGLGMVAHHGTLYRVGGFTARNRAGEEQDLHSQADFARWSPGENSWQELPPLPAGRSSHDAAVVGDSLYVVGGWQLRGRDQEPLWHDSAYRVNLRATPLVWEPLASPALKRRALALAPFRGKLFALGGMLETGSMTTAVHVFDPRTREWTEGPSLLGTAMDGFGVSAFPYGDHLYATTMSGSIQRLSADGTAWEYQGQLAQPRFFHRLLPWDKQGLVVLGGAHMAIGKIELVEFLPVKP